MQITLSRRRPAHSDTSHSSKPFTILMVYEDYESGQHAKRIYDHLAEQLSPEIEVTHQMWKFDTLGIPKLCEMAVKDATDAEIIIVAGQDSELPPEVCSWIESWANQPSETLALVALFHAQAYQTSLVPACKYLSDIAKQLNIDFFAYPGQTQQHQSSSRLNDSNATSFTALANAVETAYPHWGIND